MLLPRLSLLLTLLFSCNLTQAQTLSQELSQATDVILPKVRWHSNYKTSYKPRLSDRISIDTKSLEKVFLAS